ncbi:MAG: class I SAM-dependent methyltransferase [Luteibaculum sp.]
MHCPSCKHPSTTDHFSIKDHSVSQEIFDTKRCNKCSLVYTAEPPGPEQIGPYYESEEYVSHNETKKGFIFRLYHIVKNYSLKKKLLLLQRFSSGQTVLDYGCGAGAFLQYISKQGYTAYGVEPSDIARKLAAEKGLSVQSSLKEAHIENKVDIITMWHVLEHVHDLHETIETLKDKLNPNGYIFVAVPNHTSFDARFYKKHWAAYDVPRHLYHFNKKSMATLMAVHQLSIIGIKNMPFDSFYVSMLSEQYVTKPLPKPIQLLRACFIALISNILGLNKNQSSLIYVIQNASNPK